MVGPVPGTVAAVDGCRGLGMFTVGGSGACCRIGASLSIYHRSMTDGLRQAGRRQTPFQRAAAVPSPIREGVANTPRRRRGWQGRGWPLEARSPDPLSS